MRQGRATNPGRRLAAVAAGVLALCWAAGLGLVASVGDAAMPAAELRMIVLAVLVVVSALVVGTAVHVSGVYARLAREDDELRRLATTDPLTGALNHAGFMEVFEREFARCRRYGEPLALMMLDIDFFRRINDGYGHPVGDATLKAFVATLRQGLRNLDAIGRLAGKEFAVLLPNTAPGAAQMLADRLRERVAAIAVATESGDTVRVTTSIGVTGIDTADTAFAAMRGRADQGLELAKANGRNRVELIVAPPPPQAA